MSNPGPGCDVAFVASAVVPARFDAGNHVVSREEDGMKITSHPGAAAQMASPASLQAARLVHLARSAKPPPQLKVKAARRRGFRCDMSDTASSLAWAEPFTDSGYLLARSIVPEGLWIADYS
jgi:hypothetical protein